MHPDAARLRFKTWIFTAVVVLSNAFGDFFVKRGIPDSASLSNPLEYIAVLFQPWVALGVLLLVVWQMARMALLSWADLSYVLPVTAFSYVLSAIVGAVYFNERVNAVRWIGIFLITFGVALVAITPPETFEDDGQT